MGKAVGEKKWKKDLDLLFLVIKGGRERYRNCCKRIVYTNGTAGLSGDVL